MEHGNTALLSAVLRALPVGIIVVGADNRVSHWNDLAEDFIKAVDRPTLFDGMTLEETHPGPHGAGMLAVVARLRAGGSVAPKTVTAKASSYRVHYRGLFSTAGEYLGVAQIIEFPQGDAA